ncbi:hypothetical protein [cf. Phormidesmis sp. LEGE 11477]|uniref:hypothetical protein n=1 Tax=cf. Phormidesmis sp. LEGE 11477 TaxID=1828680 RepID=UPI00187DEEE5|nr:hypothetical protein [cf. Phormidesmis sp. LEGE 11477]MBE9063398.1 hypothetical protein [cf. Phormidesmis sp. LEGE 11477]
MSSIWLSVGRFVPLLFIPAGARLLWQAVYGEAAAQRLLALALMLFCLELANMAKVDLDNISLTLKRALQQAEDDQLSSFLFVVSSTIVLELIGFYAALVSLPIGAIVIVCSQLWFNLLAKLQLQPGQTPAVISFGLLQRLPVLLANGAGLGLLSLWFVPNSALAIGFVIQLRQWLAGGLLALVILFLLIKYVILRPSSVTND